MSFNIFSKIKNWLNKEPLKFMEIASIPDKDLLPDNACKLSVYYTPDDNLYYLSIKKVYNREYYAYIDQIVLKDADQLRKLSDFIKNDNIKEFYIFCQDYCGVIFFLKQDNNDILIEYYSQGGNVSSNSKHAFGTEVVASIDDALKFCNRVELFLNVKK